MDNKTLEQIKEQYADYIAALGEEDKAKVEACKTVDELTALAMNTEGVLPDEIAEAVAGGKGCSHNWDKIAVSSDGLVKTFRCRNCGATRRERFL